MLILNLLALNVRMSENSSQPSAVSSVKQTHRFTVIPSYVLICFCVILFLLRLIFFLTTEYAFAALTKCEGRGLRGERLAPDSHRFFTPRKSFLLVSVFHTSYLKLPTLSVVTLRPGFKHPRSVVLIHPDQFDLLAYQPLVSQRSNLCMKPLSPQFLRYV